MKLIIAIIRPEKLSEVKQALKNHQITKLTVTNVIGCGDEDAFHESYRGQVVEINLHKKVRLEIAVNEDFVEPTIQTVINASKTGEHGDGVIFVLELPRIIRIRTEAEGNIAIG